MNNDKDSLLAAAESVGRTFISLTPFTQIILGYYDALRAKQAKRKLDRLVEFCEKLGLRCGSPWIAHQAC